MRSKSQLFTLQETLLGIILSLLLILFSQTGTFKGISLVVSVMTKDIQSGSYSFFSSLNGNLNFLQNLGDVKKERDDLRQEKIDLISENTTLKEQLQENVIVNKQLSFRLPYDLIAVRVIKYDQNAPGEIIINKGSDQGIKKGQVLVNGTFAIGEIIDVTTGSARARLINSPNTILPVIVLGKPTKGLVSGDIELGLKMSEVLTESYLAQGDTVVTSGVNSNFPYGLIVGTVEDVISVKSEVTKSAKIGSEVEFSNLQELFVINR